MKSTLFGFAALLSLFTCGVAAAAEAYPTRAVRIVVPFAAGGAIDIMVRASAQQLSKELGQQMVIDNRPGASGNIGAESANESGSHHLSESFAAQAMQL